MECKWKLGMKFFKSLTIKIYPEWNVNDFFIDYSKKNLKIKIYPEWNVNYEILENYLQTTGN